MTSSRFAGLYTGVSVTGGGGAAALAAQFSNGAGGSGLSAGNVLSEASVDVEGVLGKAIIVARFGKGLSMMGDFDGAGNRLGRPVEATDALELSFESILPGTNAGGRPLAYVLAAYVGPDPQTTSLVSLKRPGNFFVWYGRPTSSYREVRLASGLYECSWIYGSRESVTYLLKWNTLKENHLVCHLKAIGALLKRSRVAIIV